MRSAQLRVHAMELKLLALLIAALTVVGCTTNGVIPVSGTVVLPSPTPTSGPTPAVSRAAQGVVYIHDARGELAAAVDPIGNTAVYHYDASGNITSIENRSSALASIIAVVPASAPSGASVHIYGSGFGVNAAQNTVSFNGAPATVISATANELVVAVPTMATTGAISVNSAAGNATSPSTFAVTSGISPVITSFTPNIGVGGTAVALTGSGFQLNAASNVVAFNASRASVTSASATAIQAVVPALTTSGHISLSTPFGRYSSLQDFYVPPPPYAPSDIGYTGRVNVGEHVTASIDASGQVGLMLFDADAGQHFGLGAAGVNFGASSCCGVVISVLAPSGAVITSQYVGSSGAEIDLAPLPTTGTYTLLLVPQSSSTGSLTIYMTENLRTSTTAAGAGVTLTTTVPGQNAEVAFSGSAGQTVSVNFTGNTIGSPCCWLNASVLNPDGSTAKSEQGIYAATGFIDKLTLQQAGTYTILVDPQSTSTGAVTVTVYTVPGDGNQSIAADGIAHTVTTTVPGQNARLSFTGSAGQNVSVNFTGNTIGSPCCWLYASVLNPDGSTAKSEQGIYAATGFIDKLTLQQTGTYTILVDPQSTSTGAVTVTVYTVPGDGNQSIAADGIAHTVTTTVPGQNARLSFTGSAGQYVGAAFAVNSFAAGDVQVWLEDANGSRVGSSTYVPAGGIDLNPPMLPASGVYALVIDPYAIATGSITVVLTTTIVQAVNANGAATSLTLGTGQNARLTFTGTAGQYVGVGFANSTFGSDSVQVSVEQTDGSRLGSSAYVGATGADLDPPVLPVSGTYTIVVDPYGTASGSVTVFLSTTIVQAVNADGTATTLTLAVGQNARLMFGGSGAQFIGAAFANSTFASGYLQVSVERPDGSRLGSSTYVEATGSDLNPPVLPVSGVYTLVIDPYAAATGSVTVVIATTLLQTVNLDGNATSLTLGMGQNARLTFAGSTGQLVTATFTNNSVGSGCCSTNASLESPSGGPVGSLRSVSTNGAQLDFPPLTSGGSYTLVIDPQGSASGSLTVALSANSIPTVTATALPTNTPTATPTPPGGTIQAFQAVRLVALEFSQKAVSTTTPVATATRSATPAITARVDLDPALSQTPTVGSRPRPTTQPEHNTGDSTSASDDDTWTPNELSRHGAWRTGRSAEEATTRPLESTPGTAALAGDVQLINGKGLRGVTLSIDDRSTRSDGKGQFLLSPLSAGPHVLKIDGRTASTNGRSFGFFEVQVSILPGQTNLLPYTIWMTRLDTKHEATLTAPTAGEVVLTTPDIPGLEVRVPAGSTIEDDDGHVVKTLGITAIPVDRPPFPLPAGVVVPVYFTVQPGGSYVFPAGARIIYPNYTNEAPGTRVNFWNYDPDDKGWYVYGQGTVTDDATQVMPDPEVRVYAFTGAMINVAGFVRAAVRAVVDAAKWIASDGDPVDLHSGLFIQQKVDLYLPDSMPLALTRTYRQQDPISRDFGIGTTNAYNMFLSSEAQYSEADLNLADGSQIHYIRTTPGTSFSDAAFAPQGTPSSFAASQITWNGSGWDLRTRDGTVYVFGVNRPLQAIRDRNGNQITLTRSNGQLGTLTQLTSPNRWIQFTYDTSDRVTRATDNIGRVVQYTYDTRSRLSTVTDPAGGVTRYAYDDSAPGDANRLTHMLSVTDARGITFLTNHYDSAGRVDLQTQADGSTYAFHYVTNASGAIVETDVTDPRSILRKVTFDAFGFASGETDAAGLPEQQTIAYERNGTHQITAVTDSVGRRSEFAYDLRGNLVRSTALAGSTEATSTTMAYDPLYNELIAATDPNGLTDAYELDVRGNVVKALDSAGAATLYSYDASGNVTHVTDPAQNTSDLDYSLGDLASARDPLGNVVRQFVDNAGRTLSSTDPLGNVIVSEYDPLNQLTRLTDPLGDHITRQYDANGNLLSITDQAGHTTSYSYDSMDRLESRTDALGRNERFGYDAEGNLTSFTDQKDQKTTLRYDGLGRRTFEGYSTTGSGQNATFVRSAAFTYDAAGNLRTVLDSITGSISYTYDAHDRMTSESTPQGTVTYTYDAGGRRRSMTVSGQPTVSYAYDQGGRLSSIASSGLGSVSAEYTQSGLLGIVRLPNHISESYEYDSDSRPVVIEETLWGATLGRLAYQYDADGQRSGTTGSLARVALPSPVSSATYDAANQLLAWNGAPVTSDADGNITSYGGNSYTWDARNQLASIAGNATANFTYDALGRRVAKTVGGTSTGFVYDGTEIVQELSGGVPSANFVGGLGADSAFVRSDARGRRSFITDALGSTIALTDDAATGQEQYTYEPYGKATTYGSTSNSVTYTGREDDGTGLDYYRARYYNPTLGRFLSQDPLEFGGGDLNLYSYAANDPVDYTDPSGTQFVGGCVGGAIFSVGLDLGAHFMVGRKFTVHSEVHTAAMGCAAGAVGAGVGEALGAAVRSGTLGAIVSGETGSVGFRSSSVRLARNIERRGFGSRAQGEEAHHIVAALSRKAKPAQAVLARFGIGIDDAENGVFLPAKLHHTLTTTNAYYRLVNEALSRASSRSEVVGVLGLIANDLRNAELP